MFVDQYIHSYQFSESRQFPQIFQSQILERDELSFVTHNSLFN